MAKSNWQHTWPKICLSLHIMQTILSQLGMPGSLQGKILGASLSGVHRLILRPDNQLACLVYLSLQLLGSYRYVQDAEDDGFRTWGRIQSWHRRG